MSKRYVAGLDGGGTKTAVIVADESGTVAHSFTSGAINFNGQNEDSIRSSLHEMMIKIAEVCGGLNYCAQICIGAAGVSNPDVSGRLETIIRETGYAGGLTITGDHVTALFGALDSPYGMILIAGTGSICYGQNINGQTHRTGGFGYLIDDEGSGYSIGRDLLSAVVRAEDGRIAPTAITAMVFEQLQVNSVQEIIKFVYDKNTNKKDIAALAPILSQACELRDAAALAIVQHSAQALVELAVPVVERLALQEGELAMAGSVLLRNVLIRTHFEQMLKKIYPKITCCLPRKDAANGAAMIAWSQLK
ncbi:N-acetylglucosamine kinase [Paenibacillus puldeungensis]|uniref:N-acetylglucosamine kinase n=1 Tax=Paenibacillus puldeungensis TaxID=696536 RepID=A0ABW3S3L4_9BACL